jgi:hypothetical protein
LISVAINEGFVERYKDSLITCQHLTLYILTIDVKMAAHYPCRPHSRPRLMLVDISLWVVSFFSTKSINVLSCAQPPFGPFLQCVLVTCPSLCQNMWEKLLKKENVYCGLRFPYMATWVCYFWACSEAEHHGREDMVEQICLPHGKQETKRKRW